MAAMPAAVRYGSASSEKPGLGAAGSDRQSDPLRAFWAVALVGGFIAVDVYARVHVAALELNSHVAAPRHWLFATALVAFGAVIRQVKMFAKHCRYNVTRERFN